MLLAMFMFWIELEKSFTFDVREVRRPKMSNLAQGQDAKMCQVTMETENNSTNLHVQIPFYFGVL